MRRTILCFAGLLLGTPQTSASPRARGRSGEAARFALNLSKAQARLTGRALRLTVGWQGKTAGGTLLLQLKDLRGRIVARLWKRLGPSGKLTPKLRFKMWISQAARRKVDLLRLTYHFLPRTRSGKRPAATGIVGLSEILDRHFVWIRGHNTLIAGSRAGVRIIVQDGRGKRLAQIPVSLRLRLGRQVVLVSARTNQTGSANLVLEVPRAWGGKRAQLTAQSQGSFVQRYRRSIEILHQVQTLLTTNKPIYQPGQVIWTRLLALRAPNRLPHARAPVTLEIKDGQGNIVFRKKSRTDGFGVAWARFQLARRGCNGTYQVRAVVHVPNGKDVKVTKDVRVYRYQLPTFKIGFDVKQQYLQPGQQLEAKITARYLTGKPVPKGRLTLKIYSNQSQLTTVRARTKADGSYRLRFTVPADLLGHHSKSKLTLHARITDPVGRRRTKHLGIPVVKQAIRITAVHENRRIVPRVPQKIYLAASLPDGRPARATLTVKIRGAQPLRRQRRQQVQVKTDRYGVAEVTVTPRSTSLSLSVKARNATGQTGSTRARFYGTGRLLIRPVRSVLLGKESLVVDVLSSTKRAPVYLDVIHHRQIVRSVAGMTKDGRVRFHLPLGPEMEGSLRLSAYQLRTNGTYDQAFRWVLVKPHRRLKIVVRPDRAVYQPGQQALLKVRVLDEQGRGRRASVGVEIVDSAVYALAGSPPALRQVIFTLEEALRDEGLELNGIVPTKIMAYGLRSSRQRAEHALLALKSAHLDYQLNQNGRQSYLRYRKTLRRRIKAALRPWVRGRLRTYRRAYFRYWLSYYIKHLCRKELELVTLAALAKAGHVKRAVLLDPWGRPLQIAQNEFHCGSVPHFSVLLHSVGPDGQAGTVDDLTFGPFKLKKPKRPAWIKGCRGIGTACGLGGLGLGGGGRGGGGSGAGGVGFGGWGGFGLGEVRKHFPESLYVNPSLRTDAQGRAVITLTMADSITKWVMTAFASDKTGRLGSLIQRIKVFKELFAEMNVPQALTRHDEIEVPVAVHNHLKRAQNVRVQLRPAAWYALQGGPSRRDLRVKPGAIGVVRFRIRALKVGRFMLAAQAVGQAGRDAVSRSIEVRPEGRAYEFTRSGMLHRQLATVAHIPKAAVPGSAQLSVKIQPEILSVVLDGLEGLLSRPYGCFEQTTSTTYPNIMVLSHLKRTRKARPGLRKKALQYISMGYQRLLGFEVNGRGFSLFGQPPANPILTAFGLQEFHDMSKVRFVDPKLLKRTRRYLSKTQHKDGSWHNAGGLIESGATSARGRLAATAYIAWSLGRTGRAPRAVHRAVRYLEKNASRAWSNPYVLALMAHAGTRARANRFRPFVRRLLKRLVALKQRDARGNVYWTPSDGPTVMSGRGRSAAVETSALVLAVLLRHRLYLAVARQVVQFLVASKDPQGAWHSTQATVLSLRALLKAKRVFSRTLPHAVDVFLDGQRTETVRLKRSDTGVTFRVDLSTGLKPGRHTVRLQPRGRGVVLYQVAHGYHLPDARAARRSPRQKDLQIRATYSRGRVKVDQLVSAQVLLRNQTRRTLSAPVAELGVPPGFSLYTEDLDRLVSSRKIQRYEVKPLRLVLYFTHLKPGRTRLRYRLQARQPARVEAPGSTFYEYYVPEKRAYHRAQRLHASR